MQYTLLFDSECLHCTEVGKRAEEIGREVGLCVGSLHDLNIRSVLSAADIPVPNEPSLLIQGEDGYVVLTGLRMRAKLYRILGPSRTHSALRLLAIETRARAERSRSRASDKSRRQGLSRRGLMRFLGAGSFGVATGALSGAASGSTAANSDLDISALSGQEVTRLRQTNSVRVALATYGEVADSDMFQVTAGGESVLAMHHRDSQTLTFVDNAPGKTSPFAFSMTPFDTDNERGLRYTFPDGRAMGRHIFADNSIIVEPSARITPRIACWLSCMSLAASTNCAQACFTCLATGTGGSCGFCALCAGPRGITCARRC